MNTVTASFDTTVRQMTEMSQQKMTEISQRKKKQLQMDSIAHSCGFQ